MNFAFILHLILCVKSFYGDFFKENPKNGGKYSFGKIITFSIIYDESNFTNTWDMKSQSNCATRSLKIVGLSVNLEVIDTRF
jgi:hypothetical protein